jgi:hypothetical protein
MVALAAVVAGTAQPASAALTDPDPSQNPCISNSTFSLTASRSSVVWGQFVVLDATMNAAPGTAGCTFMPTNTFINFIDAQSGMSYTEPFSLGHGDTLIPPATGRYDLVVINSAQVYHVASVGVQVSFPKVANHPFARITPHIPDQAATFEQIVQQDDARVYIQGDVNLDLSGMADIRVHPDVQIIGERDASHPNGPRLFTTTFPDSLLLVGIPNAHSDNVRITGIRFDGMEPPDPCDSAGAEHPDSNALEIYASTGVQVDHNEFHSWRGTAVGVQDSDEEPTDTPQDRLNTTTGRSGVWVHDNYIHDNQHPTVCSDINPLASDGHGGGYGVDASHGGFPYIEGNMFSDNRHSIAGGGENGSGYTLAGNLFLNPGVDDKKVITNYNHQIDMHGNDTCPDWPIKGESWNCGQGGVYMEVENNTVVGFTAAAIQLRGRPTNVDTYTPGVPNHYGMYVHDNTFNQCESCALTQTFDSNGLFNGPGNTFVDPNTQLAFASSFSDPSSAGPFCDFDGDGTQDAFRGPSGTFWYHSSRFGRWVYMTTNNVSGSLSFGDVNGDGLCDVSNAQGVVYLMPPLFESFPLNAPVPNLSGMTQAAAVDAIAAAGLQLDTVHTVVSLNPAGTVTDQSLAAGTNAQAGSLVLLTVSAGGVVLPNLTGMSEATARTTLANAGLVAGTVTHDLTNATPGTVYTQNPAAGTSGTFVIVAPGSTVGFGVSLGQAFVPYILGDTDADARQAIASAGLSVGSVSSTNNCIDPFTVQTQHPGSGARVAPGSTVNYTVSTCSGGGGGSSGGGGGGSGGGPILPK